MSSLCISLLGHPEILLGGKPVRLETRKSLAILAYLSLQEREIPREVLAAMFWAEFDQQHAQANLRRNISSLNERLNFAWIESDREAIALKNRSELYLDVGEFHDHLDSFRKHGCEQQETCQACFEHLRSAVKLYRGDFLEGFNLPDCPEFDDWQFDRRETFRNELAFVLERLAHIHAGKLDWEEAIQYVRRWIALDRLNEPAERYLMELYAQSGNRNAALRQYEEFSRYLKEEIDQAPAAESTAVYQRIRSGGPGIGPIAQEAPGSMKESFTAKEPLLKVKTFVPSPSGRSVARSRLLTLIEEGMQVPFTLVAAPAGFGKTTLLTDWASMASIPVAWFSIDAGDNDPVRFISYLVAALESIQPGIGSEALLMLRSFRSIPLQTIQSGLSNRLFAIQVPCALVLDDYHMIESQEIHKSIINLLEHLPPNIHVIISTRSDPPFPLSRFRARRQMIEIRSKDLRFRRDESVDLLNRVMELSLPEEDIAILDEHTEGWAVGLQLAALSLRGRADPGSFIRAFTGSHRYILDYLVEEVLERQPQDIQQFLLQTSVLERLCAPLCEAVLGNKKPGEYGAFSNSRAILEYLEKANLFLVPLDEERRWFRYHHLFAELLQARLQETRSGEIPELHHRAGAWFEAQGFISEAIHHALAVQDFSYAAHLIEQSGNVTWFRNEGYTLIRWMEAIPAEEFQKRPRLILYKAWVCMYDVRVNEAQEYLDSAERCLAASQDIGESESYRAETLGMIYVLRAIVSVNKGDTSRALTEAGRAIELLPANNLPWRCLVLLALGAINASAGRADDANQYFMRAGLVAEASGNPALLFLTKYNQGDVQLLQGNLRQAYECYVSVLSLGDQYGAERLHELGEAHVDLAWLICEWNDLPSAERHAECGLEIGRQIDSLIIQVTGQMVHARILQAQGNLEAALEEVKRARHMAEKNGMSLYVHSAVAQEARLHLLEGMDPASVRELVQARISGAGMETIKFPVHHLEYHAITFARVLFAEGKMAEALDCLDSLLSVAESINRIGRVIEILVLRALVLQALGRLEPAWESLERAIILAEPQSFVRKIVEDDGVADLFQWGIKNGKLAHEKHRNYTEKLLQIMAVERKDKDIKPGGSPLTFHSDPIELVNLMTGREIEVLRLLAEGLSNQQIAGKMVLSTGTVKIHIHHILQKLEATNRYAAVIRAKELSLI